MLEFEDVVYLDVQKTGSTYIRHFLREFVATPEVSGTKHRPVSHREEGKLYIISCRDPLQQYKSLYAYGCKGLGTFRARMERAGKDHLYDESVEGFSGWLELIVSPETGQQYLSGFDKHPLLNLFGVQTLRFLRMALPSYRNILEGVVEKDDVTQRLQTYGLMDVLIKQETLNEDLSKLVSGPHCARFKNKDEIDRYLRRSRKLNTTKYLKMDLSGISSDTLSLVQRREWLFFEALGYQPYV